ncbi:DMT family transporter [Streptomyces sp. NPDC059063]|uniref:EamA family transporter n=1 Tax=unclassified Streptomyces TaxID=2593676 RepID=UPI003680BAEB
MVVCSALAMQGSQAVAKLAFVMAAPVVVTALRFAFGAGVLWALWRPRPPSGRSSVFLVLGLGTALAGASVTIYEAFDRLPLGLAVTLQSLGALLVSLLGARRARHVLWALLAAGGVVLINYRPGGALSGAGIALALGSAACWAAYILLSARVGARTTGGGALALASAWAALLTIPYALVVQPGAFLDVRVLAAGLAVAVLSTVVANSLELQALRRIPPRAFGVLVSLEPAMAALLGLLVLGERLTPAQWVATAVIVTASVGVTLDTADRGSGPGASGGDGVPTPPPRPSAPRRSRSSV